MNNVDSGLPQVEVIFANTHIDLSVEAYTEWVKKVQ